MYYNSDMEIINSDKKAKTKINMKEQWCIVSILNLLNDFQISILYFIECYCCHLSKNLCDSFFYWINIPSFVTLNGSLFLWWVYARCMLINLQLMICKL